jgi:hypothetical protein
MRKGWPQLALRSFAVLMLLLQLVLTAGHLHIHGPHSGQPQQIAALDQRGAGGDGSQHPTNDDGDHCALCWAYAVAGSALVPPASLLPLPRALFAEPIVPLAHNLADRAPLRAFQQRAPPLMTA